jgi:flagellar biosynthesis/type III secretory pathway M-ring protein FliF/YscJ
MSMPFSNESAVEAEPEGASLWKGTLEALGSYKRTFLNGFLVLLVFFTIVRPLIRSLRKVAVAQGPRVVENALTGEVFPQIPAAGSPGFKDRALAVSKENPDRTFQLLKGWMSE